MHSSTAAGRDLRRRPLNGINLMNGVNSSNRRDRNIDRISCATINSRPMMSRDALHGHSKGMGRSPRRRIAKLRCVVTYHRHRTNHTTSAVRITRRMVTAAVTAGLILTEKTCAISSALQVGNLTGTLRPQETKEHSSLPAFPLLTHNHASAGSTSANICNRCSGPFNYESHRSAVRPGVLFCDALNSLPCHRHEE